MRVRKGSDKLDLRSETTRSSIHWEQGITMKYGRSAGVLLLLSVVVCCAVLTVVAGSAGRAAGDAPWGFSLSNMDKTCKPCDDFYQFAMGGWMKANPIPAEYPFHPGRRFWLRRPFLLRPARLYNAEHRQTGRGRRQVPAGICEFGGVHLQPRRAPDGTLPVPPGNRSRRAVG